MYSMPRTIENESKILLKIIEVKVLDLFQVFILQHSLSQRWISYREYLPHISVEIDFVAVKLSINQWINYSTCEHPQNRLLIMSKFIELTPAFFSKWW